ncbi:uncharacterized protein LOC102088598 isoform X2 [Columba livia]|uniref:uncharacterized protein LOC102088598 isoform X2 n=1 Tax=Columba livia TaxID=8932 RepID=UPI000A3B0DDB|nr:uncharacterized protein LOC102088598 isoform X2 [Columba livia]KAK2514967.1 hypothetical protein Q9966_015534 [Columba livia]
MNLILLVLLSLLTSAEATRKFISPYALPGDYLEKEDEDDDDDEKNTNVEQSPENSARTSVSHHDDGEDLLKKSIQNLQERTMFATTRGAEEEEESSQEEEEDSQEEAQIYQEDKKLESKLGPHYHNTLPWSNSDELPLDVTDTGTWPTVKETKEDNFKIHLLFAVSCATLVWSLVFMLCCFTAIFKYNIEKRNFYKNLRCSGEKLKPFSASYSDLPKIVHDSPVSRSAESSLWHEKMASDILSNEKSTKSETVPLLDSVLVMPPISHASSIASFISNEDSNEDDN